MRARPIGIELQGLQKAKFRRFSDDTKNVVKRTLSMLTATAIFCSLSIPAFAQSPNSDENGEYVVTYRAEPVTDIDALVALAEQQPKTVSEEEDDGLLRVKQLTEVREYADGSVEKDYAESAISLAAENEIALATDVPDDQTKSDRVDGFDVSFMFCYTIRSQNGGYFFRADKTVTSVEKYANSSNRMTYGQQMYICTKSIYKTQSISHNINGLKEYTLTSSNRDFHAGHYQDFISGITYGVGAQLSMDFSNGDDITIQIVAQP